MVQRITAAVGLEVVDVEQLNTHGGSLRVWLAHKGVSAISTAVDEVLSDEAVAALDTCQTYQNFHKRAEAAKDDLLEFLLQAKGLGRRVFGYGAAAMGNTLLNYAGIRADLLPAVADLAPSKQGKYLPGSHIPVITTEELVANDPDALLVLPWNLINEIRYQLPTNVLVTAIPRLKEWGLDG